jgi:hypothetical protein
MLHPSRDLLARATVTLFRHFTPELAGSRTTSSPALLQIRRKAVDLAGPRFGSGSLGKGLSIGEVASRGPADAKSLSDLGERQPYLMQRPHLLIASVAPPSPSLANCRFLLGRLPQRSWKLLVMLGQRLRQLLRSGKPTEMSVASCQQTLQCFAQIHEQMPAVNHLLRLGSALTRTARILG